MPVLSNHQTERCSPSPQKHKPYRKKSITLRAEVCSYDNRVYNKPGFGEKGQSSSINVTIIFTLT